MTRGAKIVIFSVVGLFLMAGIYYGFLAPPSTDQTQTTTTDPMASGDPGTMDEASSLTLTPNSALPEPPSATGIGAGLTASNDTMGMNGAAFAPPTNSPDPLTWNAPVNPMGSPGVVSPEPMAPVVPEPAPVVVKTAKAKPVDDYTTYVVKSGDTLSAIAGEWFHDVDAWHSIVKANPGMSASNLKVGQKINLPSKAASAIRTASSASPKAAKETAAEHVVAKGETLASISDKLYGNRSGWKRIYDANKSAIGSNPSAIKVGMKLTIPAKG
ncbi:MAG: LysM peptidoglycan-binding domain-containing protein [Phycisphaerales bacterium]|nr:LysM peptidoglycan-binding domain-containing protein [Phycisphaerales bacterium]